MGIVPTTNTNVAKQSRAVVLWYGLKQQGKGKMIMMVDCWALLVL